jgi:acetyl esterase/lipase
MLRIGPGKKAESIVTALTSMVLAVAVAGLAHPALAQKPAPKVPEGVKALRDLEYAKVGDKKLLLDLYMPEKADGPLPLIVWIHGGGWRKGSKDGNVLPLRMTRQGYAVASINYRLSGEAIFPAQIEDCKAAIRWLRANAKKYNLDPDRFGAWGSSAGGHLVALLGTSGDVPEFDKGDHLKVSSRVQAVCDYFGPTDFLLMGGSHDNADSPESLLVGGPIQKNKEKAAKANPITYVTKDDPPFLIVHGDKDPAVPVTQSELLHEALKKAGVESKLHIIKGGGHGGKGFTDPKVVEMVNGFFDKHLKNAKP